MIYCYDTLKYTLIGNKQNKNKNVKQKKILLQKKKLKHLFCFNSFPQEKTHVNATQKKDLLLMKCVHECIRVKYYLALHHIYHSLRHSLRIFIKFIHKSQCTNLEKSFF